MAFRLPSWARRKDKKKNSSNTSNNNSSSSSSSRTRARSNAPTRSAQLSTGASQQLENRKSTGFLHPLYSIDDDGHIRLKATGKNLNENDAIVHAEEIASAIGEYIQTIMKNELGFNEVYVGGASQNNSSNSSRDKKLSMQGAPIFVTSNYSNCRKLLIFVCSSRGIVPGIWSRGLILRSGVFSGSMLAYLRKAVAEGFGVIVTNPNKNYYVEKDANGSSSTVMIAGSSSPEQHMESVWDDYVEPTQAKRIYFCGYAFGGVLVKHLLQKRGDKLLRRNGAVALIESSHRIEESDSQTVQSILAHRSMYWECNELPLQSKLSGDAPHRTGCTCLSAGKPHGRRFIAASTGGAATLENILDAVFRFYSIRDARTYVESEVAFLAKKKKLEGSRVNSAPLSAIGTNNSTNPPAAPVNSEKMCNLCLFQFTLFDRRHHCRMCHRAVCNACSRDRLFLPGSSTAQRVCTECATDGGSRQNQNNNSTTLQRRFNNYTNATILEESKSKMGLPGKGPGDVGSSSVDSVSAQLKNVKLCVEDFDLLKVIGKGAFGKVMLVRKKNEEGNAIYAMKVLKKASVFAKNQVEHTKSERRILRDIDHPFVVRLRFAFQTEDKLYLVMDYYNGGSLFFHLRKVRKFPEKRARFYAAQLLLAMSHLHELNIAYRDLKLENILMDSNGYVALTDFGLSKENVDMPDGAKTFCGTAEYIAPELLKGLPYGKAVDWWGFGTLLYEMMTGQTPFFDRNRKRMFQNILHRDVVFNSSFSEDAKSLLSGLLRRDPAKRLGSGPSGAQEIMDHPFFSVLDWDRLSRREVTPPFRPNVSSEADTTNVANVFTREIPRDSPVTQQLGATHRAQAHFDGFTYMPGNNMNPE